MCTESNETKSFKYTIYQFLVEGKFTIFILDDRPRPEKLWDINQKHDTKKNTIKNMSRKLMYT